MNNEFKCSNSADVAVFMTLLFFWLILPIIAISFLANVYISISGRADNDTLISIFVTGLGVYFTIIASFQMVNQYSHIRVEKEGLYVRVYQFKYSWKLVKPNLN